jgi:hypothetical protein
LVQFLVHQDPRVQYISIKGEELLEDKMKKNTPHKQKDLPEDVYKTAVREVVDMVEEPTEPHQKAVKTREAEVRDVQSRRFCSFATQGGKHELRRGEFYIDVKMGEIYPNEKKKVVRQPNTNYIMVEPVAEKHVEAVDRQVQLLSLVKGNVMMLSEDSNDGEELEEGEVYINVKKGEIYINEKKKVVRQPNTNYIMVEPVYEKHVEAVDRQVQLLSLVKGNVMMLSSDSNDGEELEEGKVYINVKKVVSLPTIKNIRVVNSVVVQYVAVKSAVVEDMSGVPLSITRESVTRDSSDYSDREEVLAEPEQT